MNNLNILSPDAPQVCEQESLTKECYADTLMSNLKRQQLRYQSQLGSVTAAINALNKNPEVANILELISKAGR